MAPHLPLLVLSSGATVGPPSPRAPSLRELILAAPRCPGLEDWPQLEPRKALGTTPQPLNIPASRPIPNQPGGAGQAGTFSDLKVICFLSMHLSTCRVSSILHPGLKSKILTLWPFMECWPTSGLNLEMVISGAGWGAFAYKILTK